MKYEVNIQRTIDVTVAVEADSPEEARRKVMRSDFKLPPRYAWNGQKDWQAAVFDRDGTVLIDYDEEMQ